MLVYDKSLADELGLRDGDTLLSINGREIREGADIEDFKLALEESAGKPIETVVMRYNKRKVLRMKLPSGFPEKYLRAPGGSLWP
ncbi:MAG: hypothetical protein JXP48_00430 [Acidobacteria bacterium]|nr:hypothetical protein [Acidobacteriota bacterium]